MFACSTTTGGNPLVGNSEYPEIVSDFRHSFAMIKNLKADVFLPGHARFFDAHGKATRAHVVWPRVVFERKVRRLNEECSRMRILFPVLFGLALCAGSATAQSDDSGAMGQLENATSGHQTLNQTYGDTDRDPGCPDSCPDGGDTNVPDANPPQPVDSGSDQNSSDDSGG